MKENIPGRSDTHSCVCVAFHSSDQMNAQALPKLFISFFKSQKDQRPVSSVTFSGIRIQVVSLSLPTLKYNTIYLRTVNTIYSPVVFLTDQTLIESDLN